MIEIYPRKVFLWLMCIITTLLFLNVLVLYSKHIFGHPHAYGLVAMFHFNLEHNVPTFYSSLALLLASILLTTIGIAQKKSGTGYVSWLILAAIFLFLTLDEILMIHEKLIVPIRFALNPSGILFWAWIIPYGIALIVFVGSYFKFLMRLPRDTMILFIISGSIFVSGAIGFELLEGKHAEVYGWEDLYYEFLTTCEEFLEMLGIAIFNYALLSYIANQLDSFAIHIKRDTRV